MAHTTRREPPAAARLPLRGGEAAGPDGHLCRVCVVSRPSARERLEELSSRNERAHRPPDYFIVSVGRDGVDMRLVGRGRGWAICYVAVMNDA
eukprot:2265982-Prymnesium_polylepis.2